MVNILFHTIITSPLKQEQQITGIKLRTAEVNFLFIQLQGTCALLVAIIGSTIQA